MKFHSCAHITIMTILLSSLFVFVDSNNIGSKRRFLKPIRTNTSGGMSKKKKTKKMKGSKKNGGGGTDIVEPIREYNRRLKAIEPDIIDELKDHHSHVIRYYTHLDDVNQIRSSFNNVGGTIDCMHYSHQPGLWGASPEEFDQLKAIVEKQDPKLTSDICGTDEIGMKLGLPDQVFITLKWDIQHTFVS